MKTCSICKKEKPIDQFNKHKRCADGINSACRECVNYYRREAYHGRYVYKGYAKKLTPENVSKIKSQLHIKTCSQLAREYGVYPSTIEAINKNRIWRHVS